MHPHAIPAVMRCSRFRRCCTAQDTTAIAPQCTIIASMQRIVNTGAKYLIPDVGSCRAASVSSQHCGPQLPDSSAQQQKPTQPQAQQDPPCGRIYLSTCEMHASGQLHAVNVPGRVPTLLAWQASPAQGSARPLCSDADGGRTRHIAVARWLPAAMHSRLTSCGGCAAATGTQPACACITPQAPCVAKERLCAASAA